MHLDFHVLYLIKKEYKTSFGGGIIKIWWETYFKIFAVLEGPWLNEHAFWDLFSFFIVFSASLDSDLPLRFQVK